MPVYSSILSLTSWTKDRRALFVSCSATISKPAQYMKAMFGIDVRFCFFQAVVILINVTTCYIASGGDN